MGKKGKEPSAKQRELVTNTLRWWCSPWYCDLKIPKAWAHNFLTDLELFGEVGGGEERNKETDK